MMFSNFLATFSFRKICFLFCGVAASFCSKNANAAQIFTNFGPDGSCAIVFYDDIVSSDIGWFMVLSSNCNGGGVLLKSRGGSLNAGIEIGKLVRSQGLEVAVSYGSTCSSACALIWLGGTKRYMFNDSSIGFHSAYVIDEQTPRQSSVGNALIGSYMNSIGLGQKAIIFATSAPPTGMNWLDHEAARDLGISSVLLGDADRHWIDALDRTALSNDH